MANAIPQPSPLPTPSPCVRVRILHISDLHQRGNALSEQTVLVGKLIKDVEQLAGDAPIDLVVFTGDLADKGKRGELDAAVSHLVAPLATSLKLSPDRFVLVPGNHDIDQAGIDEFLEPGLKALSDTEAVDRLLSKPHFPQAVARLDAWTEFYGSFYEGTEQAPTMPTLLASVHRVPLGGATVGIVGLNSSWRATGAPNDADKGLLLLGETQAREALGTIDDCTLRIVAFHHPLEWLTPWNHETMRALFEHEAVIVLTGHEHVPDPTLAKSVRGSAIYDRAGCLYQSRTYPNSYSLLDIDLRSQLVTVQLRTWFPHRQEFDIAVDRIKDGELVLPLPQRSARSLVPAPTYPAVSSALASFAYNNSLLVSQSREILPTSLEEVLVEPRFYPGPFNQVAAAIGFARSRSQTKAHIDRINVPHLLDTQRVVIVAGDPESGVTFSLYWILDQRYGSDISRLPVWAKYEVRPGKDPFDNLIRQAAREVGLGLGSKDKRPPLTVAIDDVSAANTRTLERLCKHIAEHKDDLYILGCHRDDHVAVREALLREGVDCQVVHLGPFGRQQARALISALGLDGLLDELDRILEVAFSENLPRTPFVLAALVAVLIAKPKAHLPNVSSVLDAMIDLLLARPSPRYSDAGLDFRKREHLLEFFAAELIKADRVSLERADTERLFDDYFRARGFGRSISAGNVLNSLLDSKVISEGSDGIHFTHRSLQCVLAARFLLEDADFANLLLASPLKYGDIVRHAAGLKRTRKDILEVVGKETVAVISAMMQQVPHVFDTYTAPAEKPIDVNSFEEQLSASVPVPLDRREEQRDDYYEARELAYAAPDDLTVPRTTFENLNATVVLSFVLAGSELVDDVDMKTQLLKYAIFGWGVVAEDLGVQTAEWPSLRAFFDDVFPPEKGEDRDKTWKAFVRIVAVTATGSMMTATLSSLGLEEAIGRLALDEEIARSPKYSLYLALLFAERNVPGYIVQLGKTLRDHRRHEVVRDMARMIAVRKCLDPRTPEKDANELMNILAGLTVVEAPGRTSVVRRSDERARVIQALKKARARYRSEPVGSHLVEDELGIDYDGSMEVSGTDKKVHGNGF
jgi:hypothetical protein